MDEQMTPISQAPESPPDGGGTGNQTARKAAHLLATQPGFRIPKKGERRNIAMAFAGAGKVVYGQAFDVIHVKGRGGETLDLGKLDNVVGSLPRITLYEVKSTRRNLDEEFNGFFFSISTAEILVAQSLGKQFRFALVNTKTEQIKKLTLRQLYARTKAIYPTWSVRLEKPK